MRRPQLSQGSGEGARRRMNSEVGGVDPAEFFGIRVDMREGHARRRDVEQPISLRWNLPEPATDDNDEVAVLHTLNQFWIGAEAEIAGVTGMQGVEQRRAPIARRDRHLEGLREVLQSLRRFFVPARAAGNENRPRGGFDQGGQPVHVFHARRRLHRVQGRGGHEAHSSSMSFGNDRTTGPGRPEQAV